MVNYFAYGSNMLAARLRARVPSARVIARAELAGHALRFHKRGQDGSGKCDALETGDGTDRVHGVVYAFSRAERGPLDDVEGLGCGYETREVELRAEDGTVRAYFYVAETRFIDATLRPFDWYRALVIAGARENELGADYVSTIEAIETIPDPDAERAALHRALLSLARD